MIVLEGLGEFTVRQQLNSSEKLSKEEFEQFSSLFECPPEQHAMEQELMTMISCCTKTITDVVIDSLMGWVKIFWHGQEEVDSKTKLAQEFSCCHG